MVTMKCKRLRIIYTICTFAVLMYMLAYMQLDSGEVKGWGYNTNRDPAFYIETNTTGQQSLPDDFCQKECFLTIMVTSAPENAEQRLAIRQTWGANNFVLGKNVSLFFLLGQTTNNSIKADVMHESETYEDVIQERFIDSYNNLTLKTIFMLKLLSSDQCINSTKYLLKIDDDMFVNMELLIRFLMQYEHLTDLLMGKLICKARPITDISSKWYTPAYMYNGLTYPKYLSGTGYVMSTSVAKKLYQMALQTPILHLEDVYITGICAEKALVRPRNSPLFSYHELEKESCRMQKMCTMHHFTASDMREMHTNLTSTYVCPNQTVFDVNRWLLENLLKTNKTLRRNKCD